MLFNRERIFSLIYEEEENDEKYFQSEKFRCPENAFEYNLSKMISLINLEDVSLYGFFNNIYLNQKRDSKKVKIKIKNKEFEFKMKASHKNLVLMTKNKRRDEYIKLGFKFLKKILFKEIKNDNPSEKIIKIKEKFFKEKLKEDFKLKKLFEKSEPTSKDFQIIKKNKNLLNEIKEILNKSFLNEIIKDKIKAPDLKIKKKITNPENVLKMIYNCQQRKSLSLQDVISCFMILRGAFKF